MLGEGTMLAWGKKEGNGRQVVERGGGVSGRDEAEELGSTENRKGLVAGFHGF